MNAYAPLMRSNRAEVRNPVLALPGFRRLLALPAPVKDTLREILLDLGKEADERSAACWKKRKAPMAAYWMAVGVYARHIARALNHKPPAATPERCALTLDLFPAAEKEL